MLNLRSDTPATNAPAPWPGADSYDSLEGVPFEPATMAAASFPHRIAAAFARLGPGLGIALLVALAASWLADHYAAPVMLFALLLA